MPTKEEVKTRIINIIDNRGKEMGFAPHCHKLVLGVIDNVVSRLNEEDALSNPEKLALAEENIEKFVGEMIKEAQSRGYSEMHEDTYAAVFSRLCPIWPIC